MCLRVYQKASGRIIQVLVLYVDDVLIIRNEVGSLDATKAQLFTQILHEGLRNLSSNFGIKSIEIDPKDIRKYPSHYKNDTESFSIWGIQEMILFL